MSFFPEWLSSKKVGRTQLLSQLGSNPAQVVVSRLKASIHPLPTTTSPLQTSWSIKMLESQQKLAKDFTLLPALGREKAMVLVS